MGGLNTSDSHRESAAEIGPIRIALVTVSDTRTAETDRNGEYLRGRAAALGHEITEYRVIRDEPDEVERAVVELGGSAAQLILLNGGTGISPRDTTVDVVGRMLDKTLPGFGEIFRMLSFEEVGPAAIISRATAGVYRGRMVICTPGSPAAVRLAWEKLIAPELAHLVWAAQGG
jgi:molybdenum cofactor biosynthesis protein B